MEKIRYKKTGALFFSAFLLVGFLSPLMRAQESRIRFERFSLEEGLSQSIVFDILQDGKGFLWFCTQDGLNKYDGYGFTVYMPDPDNPHSISTNYTSSIYEDQSGILWIGTSGGGLNRFDPATERFTNYQADPGNPGGLGSNYISSVCEDDSGALWVGTTNAGLYRFDKESEEFAGFRADSDDPNTLGSDAVTRVYKDSSGVLWIGTQGGGLNRFDPGTQRFIRYLPSRRYPNNPGADVVLSIFEDKEGALWIGTASGLNRFDRKRGEFDFRLPDRDSPDGANTSVSSIIEDQSGLLWLGTLTSGLYAFDREKGELINYRNNPYLPDSLSNNAILTVYEDRSGVLWIGTAGSGLNKINRARERFVLYRPELNNPNSLSHSIVYAIYLDGNGELWVGTSSGGLDRYDKERRTVRHYGNVAGDPNSLSSNNVRLIYEDRSGVLWVGTDGGGLHRFDREKESFTRFQFIPGDPHSLSNNNIRAICEDRSGALWICTFGGGLNRFDRETEKFTRYLSQPGNPNSLSNNNTRSLYYEKRKNILWIGTEGGGLNRFDPAKGEFVRYLNDPEDENSLNNDIVHSIYKDGSGIFWLGTHGGGLNRFDPAEGTFTHYRVNDGLPNDVIYGILEDKSGYLWLSTNNGLSRFDPRTETFKNYETRDGLQSKEFDAGAYFQSDEGEMFFGGINGFNAFFPDRIIDNPHEPPVVITNFLLFNKTVPIGEGSSGHSILSKSIMETDEIVLSHDENFVSFEFAALDFNIPEKNQYAHMMVGVDQDWVQTDYKRRFATYKKLAPGDYIFKVKGSNNDGVWSEEEASIKIIITPPFWETWWFRGAVLLAALSLITVAYRVRTGIIRERNRREERAKREMEIAREIQRSFLPVSPPDLTGATIAVANVPAKMVGGDFYAFVEYDERKIGIIVGDVIGNGIAGALSMAAVLSSLRVIASRSTKVADAMSWLNSHLIENTSGRSFAAVLFCVIDLDTMTMRWCNAGLPEPVIIPARGEPRFLEMPVYPLPPGASARSEYKEQEISLTHGDSLFFLTDGVVEARPAGRYEEDFGFQRLLAILERHREAGPKGMIASLMREVEQFHGRDTLDDDFTIIGVSLDGRGGNVSP
jgi:ligand-binding sensor domain-containing protein/serine phosphatase RsbU (regulator of sigma subunit)